MEASLFILIISLTGVLSELSVKPLNVYYILGTSTGPITLDCASNFDNTSIQWRFKSFDRSGDDFLYRYKCIETKYLARTYEVKPDSTALIIKNISKNETGEYKCYDNNGNGESACANVVVFDGEPSCTVEPLEVEPRHSLEHKTNQPEVNKTELCCELRYWGNIPPYMKYIKQVQRGVEEMSGYIDKSTIDKEINILKGCIIVENKHFTENYTYYGQIYTRGKGNTDCTNRWKHYYDFVHTFNGLEENNDVKPMVVQLGHSEGKTNQPELDTNTNILVTWWKIIIYCCVGCIICGVITGIFIYYYYYYIIKEHGTPRETIPINVT